MYWKPYKGYGHYFVWNKKKPKQYDELLIWVFNLLELGVCKQDFLTKRTSIHLTSNKNSID